MATKVTSNKLQVKCAACKKYISHVGAATCMLCPRIYHKACLAIADNTELTNWVCPECKKQEKRGDNTCTPVKGLVNTLVPPSDNLPSDKMDSGVSMTVPITDANPGVYKLHPELIKFMAEQRAFRDEFRTIMSSALQRVEGLEKRVEALENHKITSSATAQDEMLVLHRTVEQLKSELNDRDQDALTSDLDIGHLSEVKGENVIHTVTIMAAKLGVSLEERDIVFAERVGAAPADSYRIGGVSGAGVRARRVVVRLARRHLRDELLQAARVRRNITAADICLSTDSAGASPRIYINERLTRFNRQLFQKVRDECRQRQWRYSWTKRGRIYVRQADGKSVQLIRTEVDLKRVFLSVAV